MNTYWTEQLMVYLIMYALFKKIFQDKEYLFTYSHLQTFFFIVYISINYSIK